MSSSSLKDCAKLLKSLAEDVRLQIVQCLFRDEYSVSEIAKIVGKKHSQVSHHLGILRNSGIVVDKREGKFVIYQMNQFSTICKANLPVWESHITAKYYRYGKAVKEI